MHVRTRVAVREALVAPAHVEVAFLADALRDRRGARVNRGRVGEAARFALLCDAVLASHVSQSPQLTARAARQGRSGVPRKAVVAAIASLTLRRAQVPEVGGAARVPGDLRVATRRPVVHEIVRVDAAARIHNLDLLQVGAELAVSCVQMFGLEGTAELHISDVVDLLTFFIEQQVLTTKFCVELGRAEALRKTVHYPYLAIRHPCHDHIGVTIWPNMITVTTMK